MRTPGHICSDGSCTFTVWAPEKDSVKLQIEGGEQLSMEKTADGYFTATILAGPGTRYGYRIDDDDTILPDPASHFQPEGVHGLSEVVDHGSFDWHDEGWNGVAQKDLVLYEIHIGTFTGEGTFEAAIAKLDALVELGITAVEIMPVSQFAGDRNWGYDGVFPYAVQNSYGGPSGLKAFVNAAHQKGLAVILDVVYNHFGPEGNYAASFAPYFTEQYKTPWGAALNFDREWSDGVRYYFLNNIRHWIENYHLDGLRLDAIHTIYDISATHFWQEAGAMLDSLRQRSGRGAYLIAESDLNNPKVVKPVETGGWAFDAMWLDDFHHALYALVDKAEGHVLYQDFGRLDQLAKAYNDGFVHSGDYVKFRKRRHGASSAGLNGQFFVAFNQNHDQIGNRVGGERLSMLVDFRRQKLASCALLMSPYLPMFFMGEEFGADTPFFFFVSHTDPELIEAVKKGRKEEFAGQGWDQEPPNPQDAETFEQSKINWRQREEGKYAVILRWHKALLKLRKNHPAFDNTEKNTVIAQVVNEQAVVVNRRSLDGNAQITCVLNFSERHLDYALPQTEQWKRILDSSDAEWGEQGSGEAVTENTDEVSPAPIPPLSAVIFESHAP